MKVSEKEMFAKFALTFRNFAEPLFGNFVTDKQRVNMRSRGKGYLEVATQVPAVMRMLHPLLLLCRPPSR